MKKTKISIANPRVRFAPSPTGYLHIGSARTALFNWLVAKKYNGKFILRIEDTDKERSKPEFEKDIIDGLKWLGLLWDEGIGVGGNFGSYRQSERLKFYEKYLRQLIEEKKAYYCFCSEEELEVKRQEMLSRGEMPRYDGHCRNLSQDKIEKNLKKKAPFVIRFKMPAKKIVFNDLIRGKVEFDGNLIGDQVIAKDFRSPLYNFAVVIDDHEMQISVVIRGEDHLSNTPKQIALYEAFNWPVPQFGHLPLILDIDRSKMSKRTGTISLREYKKEGYLPEAIVNFLVFLGWHPSEKIGEGVKEVLTSEEIIEQFSLEKVQKAGAVFNIEKLNWLNSEHIKRLPLEELIERAIPYLKESLGEKATKDLELLKKIIDFQRERLKKLSELPELIHYFFELPDYESSLLYWQNMEKSTLLANIDFLYNLLSSLENENFTKKQLEAVVMPEADKRGRSEILWPLRVALSGLKNSAGPFEIMEVLGQKEVLKRLEIAHQKIKQS